MRERRERKGKKNSAHPGVLYRCALPLGGELRWWDTYIGYFLKLPSEAGIQIGYLAVEV